MFCLFGKINIFCRYCTPIPLELPAKYDITLKRRSSERPAETGMEQSQVVGWQGGTVMLCVIGRSGAAGCSDRSASEGSG